MIYAVTLCWPLPPTTHENRKYLERIKVANIDVENSGLIINRVRDGSYYLSFFVSLTFELHLISSLIFFLFVCFPLPVHYYNFLSLASALVAGLRCHEFWNFYALNNLSFKETNNQNLPTFQQENEREGRQCAITFIQLFFIYSFFHLT